MSEFETSRDSYILRHEYSYQDRELIKVLIIDDEPLDVKLIYNLCNKSNHFKYSVLASSSTSDASERIAIHRFDVIFIDYWMGSETSMAFINRCARALKIPFVLLTGLTTPIFVD